MKQHEPVGFLIGALRRRLKQLTAGLAQPYGLTPQQFWIVVGIARTDGVSLRDLSERRRMDTPTASRIVDVLVRRGIVKNETDPDDRRRARLVLTASGRALAKKLLPVADGIRTTVESVLTKTERNAVVSGLEKILTKLDDHARRAR
ncbi:MAG TPA: MarR family winged helix-turn-helix transcriptional regulator [Candidatus Polarisedimenticolaceae bacterium]|nr:MarR family winged helix-turn-helix transcriptional regulator [Candidatus Polarisedimenticolaceae bacterium]